MSTVEFDETSSELGEPGAGKVETAEVAAPRPQAAPGKQIYTVLAREGVNVAELINTAHRKRAIGKAKPRRVEVIAPHGPSTSGGKKARQSITLAPVDGGAPAIMIGHLDVAQKVAELRDHAAVARQYRARFGSALEITAEEYQAVTKDLSGLLGTMGFRVAAQIEEEEATPSELPGATSAFTLPRLLLFAGAVLAALATLSLLR